MVFEGDSITLHCASYEKESRNISLQHISDKEKHLVEKWGLEIEIKYTNPKLSWNCIRRLMKPWDIIWMIKKGKYLGLKGE